MQKLTTLEFIEKSSKIQGNIKTYDSLAINHMNGISFGELYQKTINREQILLAAGFKLITKWESDL